MALEGRLLLNPSTASHVTTRHTGIPALPFHADLHSTVKQQVQSQFAAGQVKVVAATIAFGACWACVIWAFV